MLQDHLGEVVFVELPEENGSVRKEKSFGAVESVKATSEILSPISGEVIEVNKTLSEAPGLVRFKTKESSKLRLSWWQHVKQTNYHLCVV